MIGFLLLALGMLAGLAIAITCCRGAGRDAADPDKETPPKGWMPDPLCNRAGHDMTGSPKDSIVHCLRCGEAIDYRPHTEPRRRATVRDL